MSATTPPADFLVEAQGVVLSAYPDADPFDFSIRPGEHWLLRGASRSGKTPLLKTLCGMVSPAAGRIMLFGNDVQSLAPARLLDLRRRIGFVFSLDGLLPAWSGFENLALPLKYHNQGSDDEIVHRVDAFARRYGVPDEWMNNPVGSLSTERRATLALLRALLVDPDLLFVDGLVLDAIVAFSGIRAAELLADVLADSRAVVLAVTDDDQGLPASLGRAPFRTAEMRNGQLQLKCAG